MLDSLINSKTRIRLLLIFFISASNAGYLRGLAIEMNENTYDILKELSHLSESGYILRDATETKVIFRSNSDHPLFTPLQQVIKKHIGIDNSITQILERLGVMSRIFVLGDYDKGIDSSIIEIDIEGSSLNENYFHQLIPKIQNEIYKKVNIQIPLNSWDMDY